MAARRNLRSLLLAVAAVGILVASSLAVIDGLTRAGTPTAASVAEEPPPRVEPRPSTASAAPPEPVPPLAVTPAAPRELPSRPAAPMVQVSFKLDPRLTRGLHMGDRWVTTASYSGTGDAKNASVEARVLDAAGRPLRAGAEWFASEPDMVEVDPPHGERTRITVWREGESRLTVHAGEASREIMVRAWRAGGALRVSFAQ